MFLTIKKYDIISCFMAVFLALLTFTIVKSGFDSIAVSALPFNGKVIILDAGHGIPDGGAVGISGAVEQSINLEVTLKLQQLLEQSGAYVILTRADENAVAPDLNKKIKEIKKDDLKYRRNMRDSGCDAFVSVHMNKFEVEKYNGAQVFYSDNEQSKLLGECVQASLKLHVDPSNNRVAKESKNNIYILNDSNVASVVVECGFLSNKNEEKLLNTQDYQQKIAYGIYNGIIDFFQKSGVQS